MKLLVKGGLMALPGGTAKGDVLCENGVITRIDDDISPETCGEGCEVVDARGMLVLPGVIDAHTHFSLRSRGTVTADDFENGTRAAAFGGVTTVIDFADQVLNAPLVQGIMARRAEADGAVCVDYGLHLTLTKLPAGLAGELRRLRDAGVNSVKVFTTYRREGYMMDREAMREVLRAAAEAKVTVCVHAEDDDVVAGTGDRLAAEGKTGPEYHGASRPPFSEEVAGKVASWAAEFGTRVYFVHLSTPVGVAEVVRARKGGAKVFIETCPHYLTLDEGLYAGEFPQRFIMSPPLRPPAARVALWRQLEAGEIDTVATDHCAFSLEQKAQGASWADTLPGIPGVETLLTLVFSEGVAKGTIGVGTMVRTLCENPARIFGLWPRKGALAPGFDGDIVVFDPAERWTLAKDLLHSKAGYSPWEGRKVTGRVRTVALRGQVIVRDGEFLGEAGGGRFVPAMGCA